MIFAVLFFFQHIHKKLCQIVGIRRSSDLIVYHSQGIMGLSKIQHGLDKVFAVYAKYPGNTDNIIFIRIFFYCQLPFILCLSINIQRFYHWIVRFPGTGAFSVKHIIGTEVDHGNIQLPAHFCNIFCSQSVDFAAHFHLILCCIHSCPGCTVHHFVRTDFLHDSAYCRFICDVHLLHIHANAFISPFRQLIHHIVTKLSLYSCD